MRRPKRSSSSATNILLLVIFCVWCHVQPIAGGKCSGPWAIHACAGGNGKRSDTDDSAQVPGLGRDREGTYIQEGRGGDRRGGGGGGGRESVREGDDLMRSEVNDRRRQLDERQLLDLGNHRPNARPVPLDSALGRLRALLRKTTALHDDDEEEKEKQWLGEEEEEEESPRRSNTDRTYITKDTLTMLRRILDDIERRLDSQPVPDSEKKQQTYDVAEDNFYSLGKRSADQ